MSMKPIAATLLLLCAVMAGLAVRAAAVKAAAEAEARAAAAEAKKGDSRVFELRTYYAAPGKMEALHARFRDHTVGLFQKHGMTIVGFWSPLDKTEAEKKLVYILAYPSKEAADKSWKAFREDPEWVKAKDESERNGKLVDKVESVYMSPTDYSPMK
jgi:hypothetical protein